MEVAAPVGILDTVYAVNDAHYGGKAMSGVERVAAARAIAARQGLPGCYSGAFAGSEDETANIRLYTGERIESASARHILGEECCRALRLLDVKDRDVEAALARAEKGLLVAINRAHPKFAAEGATTAAPAPAAEPNADPRPLNPGLFCCGKCSVAMWRTLAAGGLDRQEERLARGVAHLTTRRDGTGKWLRHPFWYTVLGLVDVATSPYATPDARRELAYAARHLKAAARRRRPPDPFAARRHDLAVRALG